MSFNDVIRRRREELGWSQDELAERVGISQVSISKIEKGGKTRHIVPIARALGLDPAQLSDGIAEEAAPYGLDPASDSVRAICEIAASLPADMQAELLAVAKQALNTYTEQEEARIKRLKELTDAP